MSAKRHLSYQYRLLSAVTHERRFCFCFFVLWTFVSVFLEATLYAETIKVLDRSLF
jgi:hypothetical protein